MTTVSPFQLPFLATFRDVVVARGGDGALLPLFPEERVKVERAVEKRQREFRAGRHVARLALQDLGFAFGPLPADADGVPAIPRGVTLSLSHTGSRETYAAALATRETEWLGLDVEQLGPIEEDVARRIVTLEERRTLIPELDSVHSSLICFSCKEAVYKCVFPRTRRRIGFFDVRLHLEAEGRCSAAVSCPDPLPPILVDYRLAAGRVSSVAYAWPPSGE